MSHRRVHLGAAMILAATAAHAETITGRFAFRDQDGAGNPTTAVPIRRALVEVWRRTGLVWHRVGDAVHTDDDGRVRVEVPFTGELTTVRVLAENDAVKVFDAPVTRHVFYVTPGAPDHETALTAATPAAVLDFSFTVEDGRYADYFNIAETLRVARAWVDARRDPAERDTVDQASAAVLDMPETVGLTTFFNQPLGYIQYNRRAGHTWEDATILHEYAHYLESRISRFNLRATNHYGCRMYDVANSGIDAPEVAWMEGFAEWFSAAVFHASPGVFSPERGRGSFGRAALETPDDCGGVFGTSNEKFVSSSLWELYRPGAAPDARRDRQIMAIFDHEMTLDGTMPTITTFQTAWNARRTPEFDAAVLNGVLEHQRVLRPTTASWDTLARTARDIAVGADGTVWMVGTTPTDDKGSGVYRYRVGFSPEAPGAPTDWVLEPVYHAVRIAVDPRGQPWLVDAMHSIWRRDGSAWRSVPGAASDVAVGADGTAWVIGTRAVAGGFDIRRWTGSSWVGVEGGAVRVAVDPRGAPWVVNDAGQIFRRDNDRWTPMPGIARDIGVGADGTVWVVGANAQGADFGLHRWVGRWESVPGAARELSVGPDGSPWTVDAGGVVRHRRQ